MKFIDETEIHVTAGNGGDGMTSYRRARNRPKLGPDGGNGGNGGDVLLIARKGMNTLSSLRYRQMYKAEHGGKGASNDKTGRCGNERIVYVPCGTVIIDRETGDLMGELIEDGARLMVAKGGKRGYGNTHFTSSTNRCPHFSTEGQKGENRTLKLTLKLLADVGLAGFPNAGKSTLLSCMSAARPKIADYPFTTLVPNLGVVDTGGFSGKSFVMADVPGLIEGAADGRGLGHDFLKHLERTRVILYVLDAFSFEGLTPEDAYEKLRHELSGYRHELAKRKSLILLTKLDLDQGDPDAVQRLDETREYFRSRGLEIMEVSSVTGAGLSDLKHKLVAILDEEIALEEAEEESENPFLNQQEPSTQPV